MAVFGVKFVYTPIQLNERQLRLVRTRAQAALWSRKQARKFAATKQAKLAKAKQVKSKVEEDPPPWFTTLKAAAPRLNGIPPTMGKLSALFAAQN
ncbi:hypothetical protein E2C01_080049 [Portunus trituberculatus]|uniref:Uncharacterized protein n=1 Tax=Portunus trituberculatus TaxID=210409 RepID=A0A5B7ISD9_PORTR|nr:hypothetical protein [Portunus trituberculatus]